MGRAVLCCAKGLWLAKDALDLARTKLLAGVDHSGCAHHSGLAAKSISPVL